MEHNESHKRDLKVQSERLLAELFTHIQRI